MIFHQKKQLGLRYIRKPVQQTKQYVKHRLRKCRVYSNPVLQIGRNGSSEGTPFAGACATTFSKRMLKIKCAASLQLEQIILKYVPSRNFSHLVPQTTKKNSREIFIMSCFQRVLNVVWILKSVIFEVTRKCYILPLVFTWISKYLTEKLNKIMSLGIQNIF